MAQLKAAIFDFGGVMTEPLMRDFSHADDGMAGIVQFYLAEMRDFYHLTDGVHDLHQLETGLISDIEFFSRLCARYAAAGNPEVDPARAQHAVFGREMIACGAMIDAVGQLRSAGIRTALLTNISRNSGWLWQELIPHETLFDTVVDSSAVGMRKPDPAVFRLTADRLGVAVEECLFVDDLACNIDAAAALGMTVLHCHDPVQTADAVVRVMLGHGVAEAQQAAVDVFGRTPQR